MPEVCRFYGIVMRMYALAHSPPHFHAVYGEHEALVEIENLRLCGAPFPRRQFDTAYLPSVLAQKD